jgi:AhpC/TSA family
VDLPVFSNYQEKSEKSMKTRWLLLLAGCALLAACQRPKPSTPASSSGPATTTATGDGGAATDLSASATTEPDPGVALTEMIADFGKRTEEVMTRFRAAAPDERRAIAAKRPNPVEAGEKIRGLLEKITDPATRFAGLEFLALNTARQPGHEEAVDELLAKHGDNPQLASLVLMLGRMLRNGTEKLEAILGGEFHVDNKAAATLALAEAIQEDDPERAEKLLTEGLAAFSDVKLKGRTVVEIAEPVLFVLQNLSIGKTAPDIEGTDFDEIAFKLSDYRGKVVVLDFWGDW